LEQVQAASAGPLLPNLLPTKPVRELSHEVLRQVMTPAGDRQDDVERHVRLAAARERSEWRGVSAAADAAQAPRPTTPSRLLRHDKEASGLACPRVLVLVQGDSATAGPTDVCLPRQSASGREA
jgi:hypothetical protein